MRFASKLTVTMLLVISITFSVGGTVLLYTNFADSLAVQHTANVNAHYNTCKTLESEMLSLSTIGDLRLGKSISKEDLQLLATQHKQNELVGIVCGINTQYFRLNNTLQAAAGKMSAGSAEYIKDGAEYFSMYKSALICGVEVATAYNITAIFEARTRLVNFFIMLELIVFAATGIAIYVISRLLTKPLSALNALSNEIAKGDYVRRTHIKGKDEVAQLSQSFDIMASAVQSKIQDLNEEMRRKDEFISAFSHELKTPMTAVIGYADNLRTMQCDDNEKRRAANYIFNEAKRVESLSQKLLKLMSLQNNDIVLCPTNIKDIVNEAVKAATPLSKEINFVIDVQAIAVLAEKELLVDLIYNLVINSMAASKSNSTITIQTREADDSLQLSVTDEGKGIPKAEIQKIVEPFYMVDKSRTRGLGGSGIGLSLCNKIALLHGTSLEIVSLPEIGTCVSIELEIVKKVALC